MKKRIFALVLAVVMAFGFAYSCYAQGAENVNIVKHDNSALYVKNSEYNDEEQTIKVTIANRSDETVLDSYIQIDYSEITGITFLSPFESLQLQEIKPGEERTLIYHAQIQDYKKNKEIPDVFATISYICESDYYKSTVDTGNYAEYYGQYMDTSIRYNVVDVPNFFNISANNECVTAGEAIGNFAKQTGFIQLAQNWKYILMIIIACFLLYLGIVKQFEPLLLIPIAFGMLLTNLPGAGLFHTELFAGGHIDWGKFAGEGGFVAGLLDLLYLGVKLGIYPCLIFMGVGAMTDFGPLIANPKSLLLGAAAQLGIFVTFVAAGAMGFTPEQASSIGIIGGADGPTAIFVTSKLAPELLGPIAVAAYSYMALVPVIQPPIMKLLTTKKERQIVMKPLRVVSKTEKIIFPIVVTIFVSLLVPSAAPLVGSLMLGNLAKECGVMDRLSKTMQNELMNIVTIFLGITVGATATGDVFLKWETIKIIIMGVVAFGMGTAGGVLLAKFMNLFLKTKINPLIGSAGVSAVPMAARVSQTVGQKENPKNFLLMHAMGPNVAGVIGSAIAAGVLLALFA